jgi:hypothetical protein
MEKCGGAGPLYIISRTEEKTKTKTKTKINTTT